MKIVFAAVFFLNLVQANYFHEKNNTIIPRKSIDCGGC